jgi:hypothetical protein
MVAGFTCFRKNKAFLLRLRKPFPQKSIAGSHQPGSLKTRILGTLSLIAFLLTLFVFNLSDISF